MESLYARSLASGRDVYHAYGAIFLTAVSSFEGMIEDLFVKLLVGRVAPPRGVRPRVKFASDKVAREVVLGGRNYADWLPYNRMKTRAEAFFAGGRPFTSLSRADKEFLEAIWCIRNALAHQSRHAKRLFEHEVIAGTPLLPRERTPTGYLRSIHSSNPIVTQYEQLATELSTIAHRLCRPLPTLR